MGGKQSCTKIKTKNAFQLFRYKKKKLMGKTRLCKEKL